VFSCNRNSASALRWKKPMRRAIAANLKGEPMKDRTSDRYALLKATSRTLFVCGLWIRLGLVGAFGVLAGLLHLFDRESTAGTALAVLLGGALLAAMSWWRVRAALALLDAAEVRPPATASPVLAAIAIPRAASMKAIVRG
jgi:hypothetical protein